MGDSDRFTWKSPRVKRGLFSVALVCIACSGGTGLIHQLMWTRRMVDLLGVSGEPTARVFGCFFLALR